MDSWQHILYIVTLLVAYGWAGENILYPNAVQLRQIVYPNHVYPFVPTVPLVHPNHVYPFVPTVHEAVRWAPADMVLSRMKKNIRQNRGTQENGTPVPVSFRGLELFPKTAWWQKEEYKPQRGKNW